MKKIIGIIVSATIMSCSPSTIRVKALSFNVASGAGDIWRTPETREKQAAFILATRPDVVCLQEVDVGTDRNDGKSAMDVLPNVGTRVYRPSIYFGGGSFGNGVWVRPGFTVASVRQVVYTNLLDQEAKSALLVTVVSDELGRIIKIGCTHLSWIREEAINQLAQIQNMASDIDLLMGDINLSDDISIPPLNRMTPNGHIDQVWANTNNVGGYMVYTNGASDHIYAAMADVDL